VQSRRQEKIEHDLTGNTCISLTYLACFSSPLSVRFPEMGQFSWEKSVKSCTVLPVLSCPARISPYFALHDSLRDTGPSRRGGYVRRWQVAAGLIYGQMKKCYRRRKLVRVTHVMRLGTEDADPRRLTRIRLLGTVEHGLDFAGQSDRSPWGGSAGASHLGHGAAVPIPVGSVGVVASVVSFCTSTPIAAGSAHAASRARGQASGTTLSPAYTCDGSRKDQSTLDSARGALVPLAAGLCLSATEA
jgi:hypothetical protein